MKSDMCEFKNSLVMVNLIAVMLTVKVYQNLQALSSLLQVLSSLLQSMLESYQGCTVYKVTY